MKHRIVIQWSIVAVIAIVVSWSIVNVASYAMLWHRSRIVWTLGSVIGAANAISVYSFVIAKSDQTKRPSIIGVLLFGCMSGALQTLLYLHDNAPLLAALVFGWFGPFAEGVLAWLHAALTEEELQPVASRVRKPTVHTGKKEADGMHSADAHDALPDASTVHSELDKRARAKQLFSEGLTRVQIAHELDAHRNTVAKWLNGEEKI